MRRSTVGGARQDEAMHGLLVPAFLHELRGEPVEQLGVGGRFAESSEVACVGRQATPEVELPKAVHRETGGEGVRLLGQPAGEHGAAAGGAPVGRRRDRGRLGGVAGAEDGEEGRRDDGVLLRDHRIDALRTGLTDGEHEGRVFRLLLVVLGQLALQVGMLHAVGALNRAVEAGVFVVDLPPSELGDLLLVRGALGVRLGDHLLDIFREHLHGFAGRVGAVFLLERGDLIGDRLRLLFPTGQLAGVFAGFLWRPGGAILDGQGVGEETAKGEVVALEDRVELMVVAAGALHAGSEEHVAGGVGQVVEDVLPLAACVAVVVFVDPVTEVAEGGERLRVAREEFVARDLFLDEAVVGLVVVVGLDDVIAVAPGGRAEVVDAEAIAVGVANQVEPRAGHALSVGR